MRFSTRKIALSFLTFVLALSCTYPTLASQLKVHVQPRDRFDALIGSDINIFLDGEIDRDAPQRLAKLVAPHINTAPLHFYFNSPGGNLMAGMEIGRFIRKVGGSTSIGKNSGKKHESNAGYCYSACSLAFLGGVYRYVNSESRYGVHRVSTTRGTTPEDLDLGQIVSAAIGIYIREMDVEPALFDLMVQAKSSEMYVLSKSELTSLDVVNNGRRKAHWSIEVVPGSDYLKGEQQTYYGLGKAIFSCLDGQTYFFSVYEAGDKLDSIVRGNWEHSLMLDDDVIPLPRPQNIRKTGEFLNAGFALTRTQVRAIMQAKSVGHAMQMSREAPTFVGYRVDLEPKYVDKVKTYLGNCLSTMKGQ